MSNSAQKAIHAGLRIIPYTPKSFCVVGDTITHKDELKAMGGAYIRRLKVDGKDTPGWCFSLKREQQVRTWMLSGDKAKTDKALPTKATVKKPAKGKKATAKPTELQAVMQQIQALQKQLAALTPAMPDAKEEKPETPCSKERIARALAGEPVSAQHWAMRHVLQNGLVPSEMANGTGLWGKHPNGVTFGESERRACFWMQNKHSMPADLAICEDCPEALRRDASVQMLWDIVVDFSGPGGKSRLVEKCIELAEMEELKKSDNFPF